MKATTQAIQSRRYSGPACRRAAAYGIDVSLIEEALRLPPQERLAAHGRALAAAHALRRAMEQRHAGS